MNEICYIANRGVSVECPENSMSAFRRAAVQGYGKIGIDIGYTADKKIITALIDSLGNNIFLKDITYDEVLMYDIGRCVSNKFCEEKIPLLSSVLRFAKDNCLGVKINKTLEKLPAEILDLFFSEISVFSDFISISSENPKFIRNCILLNNRISIDYYGDTTEEALSNLGKYVSKEKLTVWKEFDRNIDAETIKKYGCLGIFDVNNYESSEIACRMFSPDFIETNGIVKPPRNEGLLFDMHTHSRNSHDSLCPIENMAESAKYRGLAGFAVTDHCDIEHYRHFDYEENINSSRKEAQLAEKNTSSKILKGIEIGEGFWHPNVQKDIVERYDFDVVIGSVHAVRLEGYSKPYSMLDFSEMSAELVDEILETYFDDMIDLIECCNFDILAHLTCPLRYINGKYELNVDAKKYESKIRKILKLVLKRKIALEANTSCLYSGSKYAEIMPEEWILKMYKELGGYLITIGSDAHIAENSANAFEYTYEILKKIGFKNLYYFENREAVQCTVI